MVELTAGWATVSLHAPVTEGAPNPASVAVSVSCPIGGTSEDMRGQVIDAAVEVLDRARLTLLAAR